MRVEEKHPYNYNKVKLLIRLLLKLYTFLSNGT